MYADQETKAMRSAIYETNRRREKQMQYNKEHGIVPKTIKKSIRDIIEISGSVDESNENGVKMTASERNALIAKLEKQMREASAMLDFELAAELRDRIIRLRG